MQFRAPMYAVIESGGKQYRVQPGDIVTVEKLDGDVGAKVKFDKVLFASQGNAEASQIWLGKPFLAGATVDAEVVGQGRGEKVLIIKMKRRKQYRRTQGHRQNLTQLLITSVTNGAGQGANLSAAEVDAKKKAFLSPLKPKGLAFTPKTLGSRVRAKKAAAAAPKAAAPAAKAAKAPAKKAAAKK